MSFEQQEKNSVTHMSGTAGSLLQQSQGQKDSHNSSFNPNHYAAYKDTEAYKELEASGSDERPVRGEAQAWPNRQEVNVQCDPMSDYFYQA